MVRDVYGSATSTSLLNPKLAPHGSSPTCFWVLNEVVSCSCVVGVDGGADDAGVAPFDQVELRRLRHVGAERRLGILNRSLRRVIERQRRAVARVGRFRVDTVELRNPVPAARDREAARALEHADVAPVAPADIVGGDLEPLSRRRPLVFVAGIGEQHAVPQVPIPLPPRRIAFHAADAAADLKLAPGRFEQTAGVVSGCGRRGCAGAGAGAGAVRRRCGAGCWPETTADGSSANDRIRAGVNVRITVSPTA